MTVNLETLTRLLMLVGLMGIMFSAGCSVRLAEVFDSWKRPRQVLLSLVVNFLVIPVITLGLLKWFATDPLVSAGFLILAVCPGAPVGPAFAEIARGDVPCALGQMVILAVLSAGVSPQLLDLLLSQTVPQSDLRFDSIAVAKLLLLVQIMPLTLGMAIHYGLPRFALRASRPVGLLGNLLLIALVGLILAREFEQLSLVRLRGWMGMVLLFAACLSAGWLCGGPGYASRKTLALTASTRNAGVALVITSANFAGTAAVTAVIAFSLVSILGSLVAAILLKRLDLPADLTDVAQPAGRPR